MSVLKKNIVLIEDDVTFAELLTRSFTNKGYNIRHYSNCTELMNDLSSIETDYIILDLFLDNESGLSVLPKLRVEFPKSKILILTGYASIATTVQAIKLGADNYLPKPANASQIIAALQSDNLPIENEQGYVSKPLSVERLEWEHIQNILAENEGNVSATARSLNMHRRTLQRKLAKKPRAR